MSLSIPSPKFLLDENVHADLSKNLRTQNLDFKLAPKRSSDSRLAEISKKEERILVTNDQDFVSYAKGEIFSVVWLRTPQDNPKVLLTSFQKLLSEFKNFEGRFIVLGPREWEEFPLGEEL